MIKIITFTPVWRRPEVFEICLQGLQRLQNYNPERFCITPFFIVSEPEAAAQIDRYGFHSIFFENRPLGAKKNAGLRYIMQQFDFDYILEVGSDDLLSNAYLDLVEPWMEKKTMQITPESVWFVDVNTGATATWKTDKVLGLGRLIHRQAIEQFRNVGFRLWTPELNRGMDTCSWKNLQARGIGNTLIEVPEVLTLDMKSDVNINSIVPFTASDLTAESLCSHFPEGQQVMQLISASGRIGQPSGNEEEREEKSIIDFLKTIK
jgi:hypothetical protein